MGYKPHYLRLRNQLEMTIEYIPLLRLSSLASSKYFQRLTDDVFIPRELNV